MDTYQTYTLLNTTVSRAQSTSQVMQVPVPAANNAAEWARVNRAIAAAMTLDAKLTVTVIN